MSFRWPEPMPENGRPTHSDQAAITDGRRNLRRARRNAASSLVVFAFSLTACTSIQREAAAPAIVPRTVELAGSESHTLNYTPWYIHAFRFDGPSGSGIRGGGGNTMPMREDGSPSEGGGVCCTSYPVKWQPDLKLTVRWLVFKDVKELGAKAPGTWYKAENVRIPQYGDVTYGIWAIFLPGDRVRLMITDGNHGGGNNPNNRPADDDPYIAQGVPDKEANWDDKLALGGWYERPERPDYIGVGMSAQNFSATGFAFGVDGGPTYNKQFVGSAHTDGTPRKSGSNCCAALPSLWQSDHKAVVLWKRYDRGTRTVEWLRAEVPIPPYDPILKYDPHATNPAARVWRKLWIQFLPGDRVHAVLGTDDPPPPPRNGDPYTVTATVLDRLTKDPGIP